MIGLMRPLCHLGVRRVSWITSAVPDRPHLRCTSGMYKYPIDPTMRTRLKAWLLRIDLNNSASCHEDDSRALVSHPALLSSIKMDCR